MLRNNATVMNWCASAGLKEPVFTQDVDFKSIIYRPSTEQVGEQVKEQVGEQVKTLVLSIQNEMSVQEIMKVLGLKGRRNFLQNYLHISLSNALVEMTQPDAPKSPTQKYRLTAKGRALKEILNQQK